MTPKERVSKTMAVNNNLVEAIEKVAAGIVKESHRNKAAVADLHRSASGWIARGVPERNPRGIGDGFVDVATLQAILDDEYKTLNKCLLILGKAKEATWRCANQNSRD